MRSVVTKYIKLIAPALALAVFVYYAALSTPLQQQNGEAVTLFLSANEARTLLAGNKPDNLPNNVPSSFHNINNSAISNGGASDIIVVNNKVYDRSKLDMKVFNNTVMKKEEEKKALSQEWPVRLNASDASALLEIDFNKYSPHDRDFLEERLGVMVSRARQVGLACKNFDLELETKAGPNHLLWDLKHTPKIVWCPNYKVASTTWMVNFLRLAHFNENNPVIPVDRPELQYTAAYGARHDTVYNYYPTPKTNHEKVKVLKRSIRLIIVRHPFTRLLSAYRDKMTKIHPKPSRFQFRKLQIQIISRYRSADSSNKSPHPAFPEFVQYVLDEAKNVTTAKKWRHSVKCWVPFWAQCNICSTDYNVIMKLETMSLDEQFLITISNLKELKKLKTNEWRHLRNETSRDLAPEYYGQVTKQQMKDLQQTYKLDFDAFGYTIEEYLAIAKDSGHAKSIPQASKAHEKTKEEEEEERDNDNNNKEEEEEEEDKKIAKRKHKKQRRNKKKNKRKKER